jgi:tetratricopeptide (TPR) repeat protein
MMRRRTFVCRFFLGISTLAGGILLSAFGGLCTAQVSGLPPEEHLKFSATPAKTQQQLLSDLSSARLQLESRPSAEANLALGRALKALGESDAAAGFFERALELNAHSADAWFEKGLIVTEHEDWSKAADLFRHALAASPDYVPAHLSLGEMLLRVGDFDAAVGELKTALRLDPQSAGAHQGLGLIALQQGKLDLSADEFSRALAIRPNYIDAEKGFARVLSAQHKWSEAIILLRKTVAAYPNSSEHAFALGTALANTGDKSGAAEQFARSRELSNQELTLLRAKGDSNWGVALRNEGNLPQAAAAFHRAIHDDPTFCDAHDSLGEVLWAQKDLPGALSEFQAAVHCDPASATARNNLASALLYYSHDIEGAIEQLHAALEQRPGFAMAHLNLGKALASKQNFTSAESELRSAIAIDPTSASAHVNLGLVLAAKSGKVLADAQSEMEKGIHLDPRLREIIPQPYLAYLH